MKQLSGSMTREEVKNSISYILDLICDERIRQDEKFGEQNHIMAVWVPILVEEVGEVSKAILERHFGISEEPGPDDECEIQTELIQVAAVCISMIECLGRNGFIGHEAVEFPV